MYRKGLAYRRWQDRKKKNRVKKYWTQHRYNKYLQTEWDTDPRNVGVNARTPDRCGKWCWVCSRSRKMWGPSFSECKHMLSDEWDYFDDSDFVGNDPAGLGTSFEN